jgi:eukaryotic-like serine/threonine-protein kinase
MVDVDQKKVRSIFLAAVEEHAPEGWDEYLGAACQGEPELRRRVEVLLLGHNRTNNLLDNMDQAPVPPQPSVGEGPGTLIGPYKLLEQIGEGGFGVVFMAEQQQPVRRKVALKIVKPGMDTRRVVARFEAERQALALMDHPNIAQVFDGGATESGRPYFVMELVRGIPITDFCDRNHLGVRERLGLFIHVCQAVQHAHQKGIIHRDLKPNNVMVTQHDVTPVVKIIDFGIAKATGQQLTEKTLFTNFAQMIGTPMYMSPEQAQMSGLDVDTRSDVYSLGVLLYELMTGNTPFDKERMRTVAYDEMIRIIREEEPLRPSTRISTLALAANTVPDDRSSTPQKLRQLLRGELDWIVMRALEKDRNRRYDSASALADDVRRYLHDEAVLACPPTVGYRLWRIVRRHKRSVVAASLVLLALVGGIVGTTWGLFRATDARRDAVNEANQKQLALADREVALGDAKDKLYLALLNQARVVRLSGRVGQRFESLKAIREAAKIRVTPELRNEAVAALVLPDAEIDCEWDAAAEDALIFSPDANFTRYARLDRQGRVTVCRLVNGHEEIIFRLPIMGSPTCRFVRLSPDGRYVACGQSGVNEETSGPLCVWKLDGPAPKMLIEEPLGVHNWVLDFHADGRQLAVGHADASISVYDLASGQRTQRIKVGAEPIHLAYHPSDIRLAVASARGVCIFAGTTGQELHHWPHAANCVAWNPDGRRIATGGMDQKIHFWDAASGRETITPLEHGIGGLHVAFNHSGNRLLSKGWSGQTLLWDTATGRQLLTIPGECYLQCSHDGRMFGYGLNGNQARLWRLAEGAELKTFGRRTADDREQINRANVHADGDVVAASSDNWLYFFSLASGDELAAVRMPTSEAAIVSSFDRSFGWITGGTSGVLFWPAQPDSERPSVLQVGPPQQLAAVLGSTFVTRASLSLDGRVLAVPDGNHTLVIDRESPERRLRLGPQYDLRFCAVSPDHRWVATGSHWSDGHSKSLKIWESKSGKQVHELPLVESANPIFSPDGRWLVTTDWHGAQLWETGTWTSVRRFTGRPVIFSLDSQLLAMSDMVGAVQMVATGTGREVARFSGPDSMVPLQFTPDGTRLIVSCTGSKGLAVWDLRLIRQQLKAMNLDWEWPEFTKSERDGLSAGFPKVEVQLGDLATTTLSREQQSRRQIERYRRELETNPESAEACNNLAWHYLAAPEPLRDVKAAVPLAEKAMRLAADNTIYRNTFGVACYRDGRYRDAIEALQPNLEKQTDWALSFDLYFLAMSHHQIGETERAQDYYHWAVRWTKSQSDLSVEHLEELATFRAEAEAVLKLDQKPSK